MNVLINESVNRGEYWFKPDGEVIEADSENGLGHEDIVIYRLRQELYNEFGMEYDEESRDLFEDYREEE